MDRTIEYLTRYSKLAVCLGLAVVMVWRANSYVDPKGPSLVPVMMCTLFAMAMTFTGFALASRQSD